jgi:hypothetical protein
MKDDPRERARQLIGLGWKQAVLKEARQGVALSGTLAAADEYARGRRDIEVQHLLSTGATLNAGEETILREHLIYRRGCLCFRTDASTLGEHRRRLYLMEAIVLLVGALEEEAAAVHVLLLDQAC